jgi:hypothetical protein
MLDDRSVKEIGKKIAGWKSAQREDRIGPGNQSAV